MGVALHGLAYYASYAEGKGIGAPRRGGGGRPAAARTPRRPSGGRRPQVSGGCYSASWT